jgi:hypothetical protein
VILTQLELRELTGSGRRDAQARELAHLGIPFRQRRDGSIIVLRADLHATSASQRQAPPALRLP